MSLFLLSLASAWAGEYRRLELADGRSVVVEVVGSEATGLVVEVPQGRMHLPYEQVLTITPVEPTAYTGLKPLRILVLPFVSGGATSPEEAGRVQGLVWHALDDVPATDLVTLAQVSGYAPASTATALAACGADLGCVRARISAYDVDLVVGGTVADTPPGRLALVLAWPAWPGAGATAEGVVSGGADSQHRATRVAVAELLGIEPPAEIPAGLPPVATVTPVPSPTAVAPTSPTPTADVPTPATDPAVAGTAGIVPAPEAPETAPIPSPVHGVGPTPGRRPVPRWTAAIPLPGVTAWAGGDVGHGLASVAITVPATVGIGWVAGTSSSRPAEVIGISAVGWWALCAFTNLTWMPTVTPNEGGGATVTMGTTF